MAIFYNIATFLSFCKFSLQKKLRIRLLYWIGCNAHEANAQFRACDALLSNHYMHADLWSRHFAGENESFVSHADP